MMSEKASKVLLLARENITAPSFAKEPQNFALSAEKLLCICQEKGIDISRVELENMIRGELSTQLWSEICAAQLYITGIKG